MAASTDNDVPAVQPLEEPPVIWPITGLPAAGATDSVPEAVGKSIPESVMVHVAVPELVPNVSVPEADIAPDGLIVEVAAFAETATARHVAVTTMHPMADR